MKNANLKKIGSQTAKRGFRNEIYVLEKFNNWQKDQLAQKWLKAMGYVIDEIENVKAIKLSNKYKADIQVKLTIYTEQNISIENLSIKLVSNPKGYNQVDKRWVDKYKEIWNIPDDIARLLKMFTGEISPDCCYQLKDKRRMFFNEMTLKDQQKILIFFSKNKKIIISDILKGRGEFSADWMLVILKIKDRNQWILKSIHYVMQLFSKDEVVITPRGNLKIGKITVQRKGGDGGRKTATMLQFKINPIQLFFSFL